MKTSAHPTPEQDQKTASWFHHIPLGADLAQNTRQRRPSNCSQACESTMNKKKTQDSKEVTLQSKQHTLMDVAARVHAEKLACLFASITILWNVEMSCRCAKKTGARTNPCVCGYVRIRVFLGENTKEVKKRERRGAYSRPFGVHKQRVGMYVGRCNYVGAPLYAFVFGTFFRQDCAKNKNKNGKGLCLRVQARIIGETSPCFGYPCSAMV